MTIEEIRATIKSIAPDAIIGTCNANGEQSIEWYSQRARLGFVLDNENTSSWFMVLPDLSSKSDFIGNAGIELVQELSKEFAACCPSNGAAKIG